MEIPGPSKSPKPLWMWGIAVFLTGLVVLSMFAWDRLKQPSPHFHFVDLAWSLLHGRLDTDTPRRTRAEEEDDVWAPRGYYDAIRRQPFDERTKRVLWNDWSSYRVIELKDGQVLKGVFPWRDKDRRTEFHALDGKLYKVDCRKDVKKSCWQNTPETLKYHVSFPPGPAVVMMPLVTVWGYDTNDVLFTLFFASLNGLLIFLLLESLARRGHSGRSRADNLWLTALFVFGTVHFFSSVRGEVWFTALVLGVTFNVAAIWCAIDLRRPLFAGLFVGLGMATRTPLAFSCLLIALLALLPEGRLRRTEWRRTIGRLALFALPVAAILAALMAYNMARFENPLEFGHSYLMEGTRHSIREHGLLSGWFLGPNLAAALTNPPVLTFGSDGPWLRITQHGLGLLWTTPALLLLIVSPRRDGIFWPLVLTAFVVALPGLFYQNTGWKQFGYRFSLDWLPFLVCALAVGGRPLTWRIKAVIGWGIAVNAFGAATFGRWASMYY